MNHDIGDNQGRIGMASVNASRAIFGLQPLQEPTAEAAVATLWQRTGGARVSNGFGLHYEAEAEEAADTPITSPEAEQRTAHWLSLLVGLLCFGGMGIAYVCAGRSCF